MDRKEFFLEIRKSLFETVRHVSAPFVDDELKKVDNVMETITRLHWAEVPGMCEPLPEQLLKDETVRKQPIMLYRSQGKIHCLHKKCTKCNSFLNYIPYSQQVKCLSCDESAHLHTKEGSLQLQFFQTKVENKQLYVGIPLEYMKI